jgi:hypothetical protein
MPFIPIERNRHEQRGGAIARSTSPSFHLRLVRTVVISQ